MEKEDYNPPFSKSFVLKTTFRHCRRSIDISIRKTFERLKDFDQDSVKGREIIETLSTLHTIRGMLDEFQNVNRHLFKEEE